jgi:hypothetical protein
MIVPGSYVSFHSALAHHGWIPEAVLTTTSVTPGRKTMTERHEQFGQFTFRPLALAQYRFLDLVQRVDDQGQNFLVASPLRAFMDLVCLMKVDWPGMEWAEDNLRIEPDRWKDVTTTQLSTLRGIYKQHRVHQFIKRLEDALGGEPSP